MGWDSSNRYRNILIFRVNHILFPKMLIILSTFTYTESAVGAPGRCVESVRGYSGVCIFDFGRIGAGLAITKICWMGFTDLVFFT